MADNLPEPEGAPPPPSPSPDGENSAASSGRVALPPGKTSQSGRVVVTLASVAKTPPPIPPGTGRSVGPPKTVPIIPVPPRPSILPAKESSAPKPNAVGVTPGRTPQFSRTMEVKLPPKTGMLPKLTSLASMPVSPAGTKAKDENPPVDPPALRPLSVNRKTPPPLPITAPDDAMNPAAKRRTGILLKAPVLAEPNPSESIFIDPNAESPVMIPVTPRPAPAPIPAPPPPAPQSLETFSRSQDIPAKVPAEIPPQPRLSIPPTPAPVVLPPPPSALKPPVKPPPLPPPVLLADSLEVPSLHVAPPLVAPAPSEKLRLPPALHEPRRTSSLPPPPVARAPARSDTPQKISSPITVGVPIDHAPGASARAGAVPPPVSQPPAGETAVPSQPHVGKLAFPTDKLSPPVVPAGAPEMEKAPPFKSVEKPVAAEPPIVDPLVAGSPTVVPAADLLAGAPPIVPTGPGIAEAPKISTPEQPREIAALTPLVGAAALASKAFDGKKIKPGQLTEPPPPTPRISSTVRPTSGPPVPVITLPAGAPPAAPDTPGKSAATRTARARKRRIVGAAIFYGVFAVVLVLLYVLGLHFSQDTRVEGQVIPPPGMTLNNEVWIVNDFRELSGGIADDLAAERAPKLQEIQERQDHVHRAQADIASREERIRLLQEQIQAARDETASIVKQAHDAAQAVWDGPGAELENEYNSRLNDLQQAIAARAKSLKLDYQPDDTYHSPEVWANAYRLALYQTPPGVDGAKEHQWIEDQMTAWRAFTKSVDDRQQKLRAQAAQIQLSPTTQVTDLNDKIEDLQHRVDSTVAEEEPIKAELQQAQADLDQAQTAEAGLDDKYYQQLDALPESNIAKRLPLLPDGRFSWSHPEKDSAFDAGEKTHSYWLFTRAIRSDGRQYWVLARFPITLDTIQPIMIPPESFLSTKAILRPDLSPDEQQQ
jgi:hypothetical protein